MSHLKEPITLSFTTNTPGTLYELIYPSVTQFTFNTNFSGSKFYLLGANPGSTVTYTVKNETTTNTIGTVVISTGGTITPTAATNLTVDVGDVLSIKADTGGSMGAFGMSLVGER